MNELKDIQIKDYTYDLPHGRIAEFPLEKRDASKLLLYQKGSIQDRHFFELPDLIEGPALLVLNDTKVIEARIFFQKPTGGVIEIFCLEPAEGEPNIALHKTGSGEWKCLIGGASKWKPGQVLHKELNINNLKVALEARYLGKSGDSFTIKFTWEPAHLTFETVIHAAGAIPLPPYIKRSAVQTDAERYQTVFNKEPGSVAAPTAALHFTPELMEELQWKKVEISYVTLHVGAGTFKPVKTETIGGHEMHSEPFSIHLSGIEQLIAAQKIIAVGTTSLRTLESLYWMGVKLINSLDQPWTLQQWEAYNLPDQKIPFSEILKEIRHWMRSKNIDELHCRTSLIIVPGYQFRIPQALITNFHQPQSTLLLLVAAFVGPDWKKIYQHALENGYRFLSYGDSSLLWRQS